MLRSFRSFTFFAKECCFLWVLLRSLQNNAAFFYILKKRMQRNASFFWVSLVAKNLKKEPKRTLRALKERKRTMHSERKRTLCPTLPLQNLPVYKCEHFLYWRSFTVQLVSLLVGLPDPYHRFWVPLLSIEPNVKDPPLVILWFGKSCKLISDASKS